MKKILLVAVNAKYIHSNPAVYSLRAYAASVGEQAEIAEFTINQTQEEVLCAIYRQKPDVVAFSCYIWNVAFLTQLIRDYKKIAKETKLWIGGPEVSYRAEEFMTQFPEISVVMSGEGEVSFTELIQAEEGMKKLSDIRGITYRSETGELIVNPPALPVLFSDLPFLYSGLTKEEEEAFANRIVYYESSRGCPFSCTYCLSSVDRSVRFRRMELVKEELLYFINRNTKQVKFVDRTFNCNPARTLELLSFIKEHDNGITNFHFEIAGDLLTEEEIALLQTLRPGQVQLEIGIQTTNEETLAAILRKCDMDQLRKNVSALLKANNVHLHLDLIAGLPYETYARFQRSFNEVFAMKPHALQLGFLKILSGAGMSKETDAYGMVYHDSPPYEVMSTKWISFDEILRQKGVEEMTEVYYNSGQFVLSVRYLLHFFPDAYAFFDRLSQFYETAQETHIGHSRVHRCELLEEAIRTICPPQTVDTLRELMVFDLYAREKCKARPAFASSNQQQETEVKALYRSLELQNRRAEQYHIEYFSFDPYATAETGECTGRGGYYLFDYQTKDVLTGNVSARRLGEDARVTELLARLDTHFTTEIKCYLDYGTAWQLLFATILSAQCTDARVNLVTKELFVKYDSVKAFAQANQSELEQDIYATGFYHNKAKNIIACAKQLCEKYGGEVPSSIEELTALPGVGRKTANVIRGNIFMEPSIVVDTHIRRISQKLGLTINTDPEKIERDLMEILPREHWIRFNLQGIALGRALCISGRPKCAECFLYDLCPNHVG